MRRTGSKLTKKLRDCPEEPRFFVTFLFSYTEMIYHKRRRFILFIESSHLDFIDDNPSASPFCAELSFDQLLLCLKPRFRNQESGEAGNPLLRRATDSAAFDAAAASAAVADAEANRQVAQGKGNCCMQCGER